MIALLPPLEVLSMFMAVIACLSLFCDGWLLFCLFSKGALCVCVVPALLSLIVSVHGGHSLPVVWMCVFHGGHSLSGVRMCVVFHGGHSLPVVRMCVCVWLMAVMRQSGESDELARSASS